MKNYNKKFAQTNPSVTAYAWLNAYSQRHYIKQNAGIIPDGYLYYDKHIMTRMTLTGEMPGGEIYYTREDATSLPDIVRSIRDRSIPVINGKISFNMTVDINSDDFYIFFDFARIVCNARREYGKCAGSTGIAGNCNSDAYTCSLCDSFTFNDYIKRRLKKHGHSFTLSSIYPRIVGLWLWDEVDTTGCSIAEAKRKFVECGYADEFGFGKSEYQSFHRVYIATDNCISQAKILPMS